jgi:nucleotide-binding universal stress UspA family protein
MFKRLLVPLDGSLLAEAALPASVYLAKTLGIQVTLIHVIERNAPQQIHGERHLADEDEACAYLEEVAARFFPTDVQVERHVHTGETRDVPGAIAAHLIELESDLIVMCTHGRGGLRSRLFGSIAQQVLGLGLVPVLLIRPDEVISTASFSCRRLLVPLDGHPAHEESLPLALELARAWAARLHLLLAVPTWGTLAGQQAATALLLPGATSALLDLTEQKAEGYLHDRLDQIRTAGLPVTAEVERGDPATVIVDVAHRIKADVIVLSTHGKKGMDAFWTGSVTPKVSNRSQIPLLLVPIEPEKPTR